MKTFRLFSMAALALMMAACSSEDNEILQNTQQPGTMHFTATIAAPSGDATTRTAYTEDGTTINVKWEVGDKIALVHNGVVDEAEVKTVDDVTGKATIEADITGSPSNDDDVYLAYPANAVVSATPYPPFHFTPNQTIFDKVKNNQDGTLAYIQNNLDLRMGDGKLAVSGGKATLKESVSVSSLICIWKLTLQDDAATPNALNATKLTFKNETFTQAEATSTGKSEYYLCVVPSFIPDASGTFSFVATVGSDTYTFSKTGLNLTAGKYYQSTLTMAKAAPEGAINGRFSVSDTKKVYFSKGNLQATYNTSWSWAFATNQWDYIGNAAGNTSINGGGTISGTGTVDLFGWVGAACEWTGAAQYGISNEKTAAQYGYVEGEALKSDWGTLAITNGGNTANFGWRTLTGGDDSGEWEYLFKTRSTTSGVRYAHATVKSVPGLVLLPDDWSTDYYSLDKVNDATGTAYTDNVISSSDWTSKLEAHGAVFLPAGGYRSGATVSDAGVQGNYWSSTSSTIVSAIGFRFSSAKFGGTTQGFTRNRGCSVRLVYDAN